MQLQVNRDIEKLNAQNINNINELGDLNVGNAEAKQQSFEEQAIHGQKGLPKMIGVKKRKHEVTKKTQRDYGCKSYHGVTLSGHLC